jgi:UDP-N-acetylmuramate dehydrogenase
VIAIQEDVPLAPLTTLQVGGPARFFAEATSEDDVREALDLAATKSLSLFVLGGGSNLVVSDQGWPGLVLKIAIGGVTSNDDDDGRSRVFEAGAGVEWDHLVAEAVASNCSGIECLSGIPGSVGGTPVQNVGAYGQEVSDTIESVRALDLKDLRTVELSREACGFRYRNSIFNTSERGRYIILSVTYRLIHDGAPNLKYGDLQKYFAGSNAIPSLAQIRDAVREIRRNKGMLIVPGDPDCRSAGSFFKNPVLGESYFLELTGRAQKRGLTIPSYPALDAQHKISAAWLVEHSGFAKGYQLANAAISQKHALAVINTGTATARDIVKLKETIQAAVQEAWGIILETEPVFVGF